MSENIQEYNKGSHVPWSAIQFLVSTYIFTRNIGDTFVKKKVSSQRISNGILLETNQLGV